MEDRIGKPNLSHQPRFHPAFVDEAYRYLQPFRLRCGKVLPYKEVGT